MNGFGSVITFKVFAFLEAEEASEGSLLWTISWIRMLGHALVIYFIISSVLGKK